MKTTALLIGLLLSLSTFLHAQILDSTYIVCQYKAKSIKVTAQKQIDDLIRLEIGRNISKSYSIYTARSDSFKLSPDYRVRSIEMTKQITASLKSGVKLGEAIKKSGMPRVCELMVTYKNYPEGKITVLDRIEKQYMYEDELNSQHWEIFPDTMTVLGYVCQKATTEWRGRKYEAWFAPELPISDGPLKFSGLPGLIFKIKDGKNEYSYELEGIEQKRVPIKMDVPVEKGQNKFNKTTRKKFKKEYWHFLANFGMIMSEKTGIKAGSKARFIKGKGYDFLEIDY